MKGNPRGGDRLLFIPQEIGNFVTRLEFRVSEEGGEGALILRSPVSTHSRPEGYSIGLSGQGGWVYSVESFFHFIYKSGRSGIISDDPAIEVDDGKWQVLEVECFGDQIVAVLNGKIIHQVIDSRFSRGKLGLHSRNPSLEVREFVYRKIESPSLATRPPRFKSE